MNPIDLSGLNWSEMPWYVAVLMMAFTAILSFIATRLTSKDKVQSDLVVQTVQRQKDLDERTSKMMDDFQEDIDRLRDELNTERKRNISTEVELRRLQEENRELKKLVEALRTENAELKLELQKVQGKGE